MRVDQSPPSFPQLLVRETERSVSRRGWRALVPWWLILCLTSPLAINFYFGDKLNPSTQAADLIAILAAMAVVSSFLGATSIALTAHLQKMVSEYPFCNYLKKEGMFDAFLFWPQFTLLIQIICVSISILFACAIGIFGVIKFANFFIIFTLFFTVYTFTKTWNLIDLIRVVTWHYEDYMSIFHEEGQN